MPLQLEQKKMVVSEVSKVASSALSAVVADYRGLSVSEMDELRFKARQAGVYLRVVKNTLASKAVEQTAFECMQPCFSGPLILAFSMEEPGSAAKLFKDFAKQHSDLEVKNLAMNGVLMGPEKLEEMSNLPTREEALGMLCNVLQAPVTQLVRTMNEVPSRMVRVLSAVGDCQ